MDASSDTVRSQITALLPRLRRFALTLTGKPSDADDLVQDTVERALRHLHQWEQGTRLDSWMFRIAQNIFIDQIRAKKRSSAVMVANFDGAERVGFDGTARAEARITFNDTMSALAALPLEQRSAVSLVLIDGLSYRDAAESLQIPIGTLTSRLARAREALAARVLGQGAEA
ncbi:MAG: RNA polymerase sigma factor [Alphaproteobacteria bacterium]|nr:RNA polymerase sigma factor [Alphaproteobacteria bacterium]